MNRNSLTQIAIAVAEVIIAIIAVVAFIDSRDAKIASNEANKLSQQANDLAQDANEISLPIQEQNYRLNMPNIVAKCSVSDDNCAESIIVKNIAGQVNRIYTYCSTIIQININEKEEKTYIPIYGYFDPRPDETLESQGLLATFYNHNGDNLCKYNSIAADFCDAASKDKYIMNVYLIKLVSVRYLDFANKETFRYVWIHYRDYPKDIDEARTILVLAYKDDYESLKNSGFDLNLYSLDGVSLWNWYKKEKLSIK